MFLWEEQRNLGGVPIFHLNCQEQNLLGKSKVSLARARFPCQEQGFFGKSKVSLARAKKPWGGTYFSSQLSRAKSPWQEQGFFGKSKVSLPRARFLWQRNDGEGKDVMEKERMSK